MAKHNQQPASGKEPVTSRPATQVSLQTSTRQLSGEGDDFDATQAARIVALEAQLRVTQEQLRQANEQVQQMEVLFDELTDGVILYDAQGQTLRTNSAARRMIAGTTEDRPHGKDIPPVTTDRTQRYGMRNAEGQLLPENEWPLWRILSGETLSGSHSVDLRMTTLDGREIEVDVRGTPLYDADGAITGALVIAHDVSERRAEERRTHEALNALLAMAELLVAPENLPLALSDTTYEADGQTQHAQRQTVELAHRLAELTAQVLRCRQVALLAATKRGGEVHPLAVVGIAPEDEVRWRRGNPEDGYLRKVMPAPYLRRLLSGETLVIEYDQPPFRDLPNPHHLKRLLLAPMLIGDEFVGAINIFHGDPEHIYTLQEVQLAGAVAHLAALVVERERLLHERAAAQATAQALTAANQRMDEFLSVASHELRTPLTILRANLQLAERRAQRILTTEPEAGDASPLDGLYRMVRRASAAAERQSRLIDDLLDVSRISAGKLEFRLERRDLVELVSEAIEEQRLAWPARAITLTAPDRPLVAQLDADRIEQVIANFLTNALKYSAEDYPISVTIRPAGDDKADGASDDRMMRVEVRDQGPGLPAEEQSQVWERFHRAPGIPVQSGSGVGLGLGLSISREIVERHGGHVGVESAPGQGSTFWFELPLV